MAGAKAKDFVINILADSSAAEKVVSGFANKMENWKSTINTGSNAVLAGAAGVVGTSVHAAMQMDGVMDGIAQTTGAQGAALDSYGDDVKAVAQDTAAPLEDIGDTMSTLIQRTGLSGDALQDVSHKLLTLQDFAGQSEVDINDLSGAMSMFGVPASDMSATLDTLYGISQNTGVSVADLVSTVQDGGAALQGLGFSFEQSAQMVGSLSMAGLDANTMLAGMSKGLVTLAKDGEQPEDAFKRIVDQISDLTAKGQDAAALDLSGQLFGTKAAPKFLEAIKSGALSVDQLTASVSASSGSINDMESQTEDFPEMWEKFKNTGTVALSEVGEKLIPKLNDAMTAAKPLVMWLADHADGVSKVGLALVGVAGGIKGIMIANQVAGAVKGFGTVISGAKTAFMGLNTVMMANPFMLVVAGIAAVVAGLTWFFTQTEVGRQAWASITAGIHSFIDWIGPAWSGLMNGIGQAWSNGWNAVVNFVTGIPDRIMAGLTTLGMLGIKFAGWVGAAKDAAVAKFAELVGWVTGLPGRILSALGNVGSLLWNAGTSIITGFWNGLTSKFDDVKKWVGGIGTWIADHKGPRSYDLRLLTPNGGWIMDSLITGMQTRRPALGAALSEVAGMIADGVHAAPTTQTLALAGAAAASVPAVSAGSGPARVDLGGVTVVDREGKLIAVLETVAEGVAIDVVNARG